MNPNFQHAMAEATRLMHAGDLNAATALIQATLHADGMPPAGSPFPSAWPRGDVIDIQARVVDSVASLPGGAFAHPFRTSAASSATPARQGSGPTAPEAGPARTGTGQAAPARRRPFARPYLKALEALIPALDGRFEPFSMPVSPQVPAAKPLCPGEGFDKVKSAGREAAPFLIRALQEDQPIEIRARAVIDASGTWSQPNPLGASGVPAIGERENTDAIFYGIPDVFGRDRDRERYAGRRTLVVGAGHSAANALLALAELSEAVPATRLAWAVRSPMLARVFGGGDADALPARGALGASLNALRDGGRMEFVSGLRIAAVRRNGVTLTVEGTGPDGRPLALHGIDQIVCATGQRPDLAMVGELRLKLDPWLESTEAMGPLIDPNVHSCGTVRPHGHWELAHPEPGFYTLGVKSYGRAPTFLMATGFEQARSVVAAIAGDLEAADRVELDLPETGVCSVSAGPASGTEAAGGCCGGPAKSDLAACCVLDEQKKAQGESGCG